ncbi:hypothetical protein [Serinicoccus chungangensis]|uniref:hypothetical protein n=1 Tax=Serinicoccus chungangensis TaxID=767452 RepID=UPI00111957C8|nr:hypothetical protein [Serinicoccus chungangensis]
MGNESPGQRAEDLPERELLQIYLQDHLTGATGLLQRLTMMRDNDDDLPVAAEIAQLEQEVREDRQTLVDVIRTLGLRPSPAKLLLARAGEMAGRLKLNGRVRRRSPLTPLLELEVVQAGISGKSGLWRSLTVHAEALGLDAEEFRALEERAQRQLDDVVAAHRRLTRGAFG